MNDTIFIDTSAFLALYIKDDAFHASALQALEKIKKEHNRLITSNFILDEVYTFLRARKSKELALDFAQLLIENSDIVKVIRITVKDEQEA